MSAFEDYQFSPAQFSGVARLFPIPNLVMFPNVMQPLHVFEPRYRALLNDAMENDHLIAVAILAPGWESDYEGRPPLERHACLGRVVASQTVEDGSDNLLLVGVRRICLLDELPPTKAYREAHVAVCEDIYPPDQVEHGAELKRQLCARLSKFLPGLNAAYKPLEHLLDAHVSLGVLTDVLSYALDLDLPAKETLLSESNVYRRAELILECLANMDATPGQSASFPPDFSSN
jgi:Lon protease-like protein